jgi:hypothetical protein
MSWIDYHKMREEEAHYEYDSDSDFEDLSILDISAKQKFPSYPIAAAVNEPSNTTQINPSDSPF